jgi:hypothetical protein
MQQHKLFNFVFVFLFGLFYRNVLVVIHNTINHSNIPLSTAQGGTTYFVSSNGSDTDPGTLEQPFRTIQRAADLAVTGDTIYIREGTYDEKVYFENSGTTENPIRIMGYPGDEMPIIDGQNQLGTGIGGKLVWLIGDYIEFSGIEVTRSGQIGLLLSGKHGRISNVRVHHNQGNGVFVNGDFGIVEGSEIWWNAANNEYGSNSNWGSGLSAARHPNGVILRNNYVHDNWGEGLSTFEATGTVIEGNKIADNWSVNLYVSDATDVIVRDNFVYTTPNSVIEPTVGIGLWDERCSPCSERITVTNNYVKNAGRRNLAWWYADLIDTVITGNTFENALDIGLSEQANVFINTDPGGMVVNSTFENNNIIQTDGLLVLIDHAGIVTTSDSAATHVWPRRLWKILQGD